MRIVEPAKAPHQRLTAAAVGAPAAEHQVGADALGLVAQPVPDRLALRGEHRAGGHLIVDAPATADQESVGCLSLAKLQQLRQHIASSFHPLPAELSRGPGRVRQILPVHGEFVTTLRLASGTDRGNSTAKRSGQGRHGRAGSSDLSPGVLPLWTAVRRAFAPPWSSRCPGKSALNTTAN